MELPWTTGGTISGRSKGELGGTEFPHLLFWAFVVPPQEEKGGRWEGGKRGDGRNEFPHLFNPTLTTGDNSDLFKFVYATQLNVREAHEPDKDDTDSKQVLPEIPLGLRVNTLLSQMLRSVKPNKK